MSTFTKNKAKKNFCKRCLHCFSKRELLENHGPDCFALNGTQKIELPKPGSKVFFKNYHKMQPVPFVINANFEAVTKKITTCSQNNDKSYTDPYQEHQPCGYGYKVVCHGDKSYSKPVKIYRGEDAIEKFIENINSEAESCLETVKKHFNKLLIMTEEDELDFMNSFHCYICEKRYKIEELFPNEFKDKKIENIPVRDHCHITGKYRGSAHKFCNLKLRIDPEKLKIPIVFHNLKGYDSHFIIKKLEKNTNISAIANNFEKYITFKIDNLQFIDSFQFMSQSLDQLVGNHNKEDFIYTDLEFKDLDNYQLELLKKKGVYPYSYMDSFSKFEETELPSIDKFYNDLNNTAISESDYQHANEVWESFKIKNLGEYHDLYLRTDVLLLTDVFENFRDKCLKYYGLDPCHYFTSPGLAWDAMLKKTKVKLDLITDIDMQLFIEKGLRGGISYIAHRYAKANNKYLPDYNPEKKDSYVMYLDANNLYGWAMSQPLPFGDFKWLEFDFLGKEFKDGLEEKALKKLGIKLKAKPKDYQLFPHTAFCKEIPEKGLMFEVDSEYPKELHSLHNEYPLAPEKKIITDDMLSDYATKLKEEHSVSSGKVPKLVTTLSGKKKLCNTLSKLETVFRTWNENKENPSSFRILPESLVKRIH